MNSNEEKLKKAFLIRYILIATAFIILVCGFTLTILFLNLAETTLKEDIISQSNITSDSAFDFLAETSAEQTKDIGGRFINYSLISIPIILATVILFICILIMSFIYYKKAAFNYFYKPIIDKELNIKTEMMKLNDSPTHFFGASKIFRWVPYRVISKLYYRGQNNNYFFHYLNFVEETKTEENDYGSVIFINTKKAFKEKIMFSYYTNVYGKEFYHLKEEDGKIHGFEKFHFYTSLKDGKVFLDKEMSVRFNDFIDFYYKKYLHKANIDILSFHISASGDAIYIYFKGANIVSANDLRKKTINQNKKETEYVFEFVNSILKKLTGDENE